MLSEYVEGAVYQSTAPYQGGNYYQQGPLEQEPPVGFMNSPLVADIANSFYMNKDAIFKSYGYDGQLNQQYAVYQPQQNYYGYNYQPYGQYGNGYYNPYYDPYEARRRAEYEMKMREQEYVRKMRIWERVVKGNLKFYGQEIDHSIFDDKWEIPQEYNPTISIMTQTEGCKNTISKNPDSSSDVMYENGFKHYQRQFEENNRRGGLIRLLQLKEQKIEYERRQEEYYQEQYKNYSYTGKNETLYEFLHGSGRERWIQFNFDDKMRQQKRNVGSLYNRSQFDNVMDIYKINEEARRRGPMEMSPGLIVNGLDDISITLPEHLKSEYQQRKNQFMNAIMKKNPNMHIPKHNLPPNISSGG